MKENVLEKGKVVDQKSTVTYAKVEDKTPATKPVEETVNKAIIKKDVTKTMAQEKKAAKTVTEEKKVQAPKKAEAPKKEAVKKEAVKKDQEPKKAKIGRKEIFIQFGNREIGAADIQKKIEQAYLAEGHKMKAEDDVKVYVKPEENMMYYVINEDYASGINLFD